MSALTPSGGAPEQDHNGVSMRQTESGVLRSIGDPGGRRWYVREVVTTADGTACTSLMFYNDDVMRRVRTYPAHWHELPDDDLYAISLSI